MATGGIFTLITNDGRQDRMLMATALLNKRLDIIQRARAADPLISDPTPTLVDIEKTHILFMNAHFKPFAAIGYEYNKVRSSSGSPTLGSDIQFSIPQFGDFFHDMVLHLKLKQPTLSATGLTSEQPLMRWCHYPGERVMKRVQFEVNGNPLDEYRSDVYNFYREFIVAPNKKLGWDRCMGQEVPEEGYFDQPTWALNGVAASAVTSRFKTQVCTGYQTPTGQKAQTEAGDVELFIPFLFWFSKDPRLAIPSVSIPFGQRFINVTLATQQELVGIYPRGSATWGAPQGALDTSANLVRVMELYINNIFVNPEVHDIFIRRIGFTLIRVHRIQYHNANTSSGEVLLQQLKWPTESLCVGLKVKDYNSTTAATQAEHLDKWHTFSRITNTARSLSGWRSLKAYSLTNSGGGTTMGLSVAGLWTSAVNATNFLSEVQPGDILVVSFDAGTTNTYYDVLSATANNTIQVTTTGAAAFVAIAPAAATFSVLRRTPVTATTRVCARTVDSLTVKAHGIPIYNDYPAGFFNAYLPFHYGGVNLNTPEDCGALFIPFCLYPGTYQPNGYINLSRAREFYLEYTSSIISSVVEGTLVIVASAINFLLISDGSAVLRYST